MADAIGAPRTERACTPQNPTPGASGLGTTTTTGRPSPEDLALSITRQTNRRLELARIAELKADSPGMTDAAAYRRLYESAIGPRFKGTIYSDAAGAWEVLEVLFGDEALARCSYSTWLLVERNLYADGHLGSKGAAQRENRYGWTPFDRVIFQPVENDPVAHAAEAASALAANGLAGTAVSA
ncbi:hypothetical protein [Streptomyces sp. NPDC018059]|uniref:hypothetical protein n=1 Tax=Streptomyces sp. NPDC018059 TaxID=3365041 RepID=UPI0037946A92